MRLLTTSEGGYLQDHVYKSNLIEQDLVTEVVEELEAWQTSNGVGEICPVGTDILILFIEDFHFYFVCNLFATAKTTAGLSTEI